MPLEWQPGDVNTVSATARGGHVFVALTDHGATWVEIRDLSRPMLSCGFGAC